MYDTSACPRCDERIETNDHLWKCEKAVPAVNDITSNFHQKYCIPDRLRNCTMLALRGIATTDLTSKISAHLKQSGAFTGRLAVRQNGVLLWNMRHVRTKYPDGRQSWSVANYSNGIRDDPATIYIDDAKVARP